jgi:hypothetical protein
MARISAPTSRQALTNQEQYVLRKELQRMHEQGWGIAIGLVFGLGLFVATIVLVIQGGPTVGQHLSLLRAYFPGYSVSFVGSLVGFVYAFVLGYALARIVVTIYNYLLRLRWSAD